MDKRIARTEEDSDGYWIYLRPGYSRCGEHAIVENTRKEALARLKDVHKCGCPECLRDLQIPRQSRIQAQSKFDE